MKKVLINETKKVREFFTRERAVKLAIICFYAMLILVCTKCNVCAWMGTEHAAKEFAKQLQWVGWAVLAVILIPLLTKRNFIGAVITAVIGAVIVIVIGNPTALQSIGEWFTSNILGLNI